jgi:subtilisin family serine protease
MVELADPPSLAYQGSEQFLEKGVAVPPPMLAATAPGSGGSGRFDARAAAVTRYTDYLDERRAGVMARAGRAIGRDIEPLHVYRHVMNGFSAAMSDRDAAELARLPGVRSVTPVTIHRMHLDAGPGMIRADAVWNGLPGLGSARGEGIVIGVIDSGINWDHIYFSDDPVQFGYEFTNPFGQQLGLCSNPSVACNNKLVGVYDFTTEGTQGFDTQGHGSHVASIAAGNPVPVPFLGPAVSTSGVAPRANIVSYKACYNELPGEEEGDGCTVDALVAALEQAVIDGVDLVNYSIGGPPGDPWAQSADLLNFWAAGIPFVSSAGNDGPGFSSISSPANAPWTLAVGSSTHDRWAGFRALAAVGVSSRYLVYGTGPELEASLLSVPFMLADDVADDLFACTPFPPDSLDGSVVLIERGGCAFATKVDHAADAGALAVLVFNDRPGLPLVMGELEGTTIPAAMMSQAEGLELVEATPAFDDPTVTMTPDQAVLPRPRFADIVADYSSRGPAIGAGDVMKPNLVAPGGQFIDERTAAAGILGANIPNENSFILRAGTSFASPHVAGAVALLRQLHPDWTPAMLMSALQTTAAFASVTWLGQSANQFERGAGRVDVERAARAGLFLPVTREDFEAADPDAGGSTLDLNLPGIFSRQCLEPCTTTRTLEALRAGSWQVETSGDLDITVTPAEFSLGVGERQTLAIEFGAEDQSGVDLIEGRIHLVPTSGIEQTLSVAMAAVVTLLPDTLEIQAEANRGRRSISFQAVDEMPEAVFRTTPLVRPTRPDLSLAQDPTASDPFDGAGGTQTFVLELPDDALLLWAETLGSTAPDIDLHLGFDVNGDGQASEDELVCQSASSDELEQCVIKRPPGGDWWVVVQNWRGSGASEDTVELDLAVLAPDGGDYSLVASGVGIHPGGALDLELAWDQPAMRRNERWIGAIGLASSPDTTADVAVLPVSMTRTGTNLPQPTALFDGQPLSVVLPPGTSHERLFIDLPSTAQRLDVTVQGDAGVEADIHYLPYEDLAGSAPGTPAATGASLVSGSGSDDGIELSLGSEQTPPPVGRYYVVLDNPGGQERKVDVTASVVDEVRMEARFGLWSPESRLIFQGIEWQRAGPGFMIWYSYDRAGLPEFYIAIGDIDPASSTWRATLERVTGNNERQKVETVGEVSLTTIEPDRLAFSWRLNGGHGSDLMTPDSPPTCPEIDGETVSYTGHWASPPRGGTTVIVTADGQFYVRYYFDDDGVGRWVFVSDPGVSDVIGEALEVRDFRGFCPNCPPLPMSFDGNSTAVGAYGVVFDGEGSGTEILDFTTPAPLGHEIELEVPVGKLSERLPCLP